MPPIRLAKRLAYLNTWADDTITSEPLQNALKRSSPNTTQTPTKFGFSTADLGSLIVRYRAA